MTTKLTPALGLAGLLSIAPGCNRDACQSTNAVFDRYPPEAKQYKDELAKQLRLVDKSKLTYRLEAYQQQPAGSYLVVRTQGEGLCARLVLTVPASGKGLAGIRQQQGAGYRGAELKNLQFRTYQDSAKTEFVFERVGEIVD